MNIHSVPDGASPSFTSRRYASRRSRFARLRSTASWNDFLETTTPACRSASGDERRHATRRRPFTERPRSKILLYFAPGSRVDMPSPLYLREALAPLGATGREHLAPTLRRLARAISDFPFPLDLGRLPCHLHSFYFLSTEMSGYFTIFTPRLSSA